MNRISNKFQQSTQEIGYLAGTDVGAVRINVLVIRFQGCIVDSGSGLDRRASVATVDNYRCGAVLSRDSEAKILITGSSANMILQDEQEKKVLLRRLCSCSYRLSAY